MQVAAFDFDLPRALIAQAPAEPRDAARLLVVAPSTLEDRAIRDLPALLRRGDVLVFNDTRVIPARLVGMRGEARVEMTLHRRLGPSCWRAFVKGARRLKQGDRVDFAADPPFAATIAAKGEGDVTVAFDRAGDALRRALERHGTMPLPPYIARAAGAMDQEAYQTIYAAREGA
ncbi:MAG: S-adenosylmethionine:tRNA ribosyltransferase-isomerase, partial [Alphaproteobacteria bacterium]|nr:S-adenosylmethionine:tRNA ribosyltransferase-isomerase [Alphaproteobacteria bacterium]